MKRTDTKKVIIENAIQLFYTKGYTDTSITHIARKCNITAAAIYHHVENKEHLLWLVYQQLIKDLDNMIIEEVNKADSAENKLITFIRCMTKLWISRPELAMLQPHPLQTLSITRRKEYNVTRQKWVKFIRRFVENLKSSKRSSLDVNFATFALANMFSSQTSILTEQNKGYKPKSEKEIEKLINTVIKFYYQALLGKKFKK